MEKRTRKFLTAILGIFVILSIISSENCWADFEEDGYVSAITHSIARPCFTDANRSLRTTLTGSNICSAANQTKRWEHRKMASTRSQHSLTISILHVISFLAQTLYYIIFSLSVVYAFHSKSYKTMYKFTIVVLEKQLESVSTNETSLKKYKSHKRGQVAPMYWEAPRAAIVVNPAVRFPDNHNKHLPLSLQHRLEDMNPSEFLAYVLKDLTLEERESLMVDERQRRKTFLVAWPFEVENLSGVKMAQAGFYFLNDQDRVQCVFCRGCLHHWELDDNPMTEHSRSFNFCRFVKNLECGNREYRPTRIPTEYLKNITKYGTRAGVSANDGADSASLGISTIRAAMIQHAPDATRLKTFSRWPSTHPITSEEMCAAGFYYTGFDDQVRCFFCSGGLREWTVGDDPWEEHARWFPDCQFLIQKKGIVYIEKVHARTPPNKKCATKTQAQQKEESEEIEQKTEQDDMMTVCLQLGHSVKTVEQAVTFHGKPFTDIKALLDVIHQLEEDRPPSPQNIFRDTSPIHTEDRRAEPQLTASYNGTTTAQSHQSNCKSCEIRRDQIVAASYVALPCGHLIYCDACNIEEEHRSQNSPNGIACPISDCRQPIVGAMKVFYG